MNNDKKIYILIIIFMIILVVISLKYSNSSKITFNHNKWLEAKESETWNIRKKMAQYLIDQQFLIGKNKESIVSILGNPEDFSNVPEDKLYFTIELDYGRDIDPVKIEYLVVFLNSEGRATKVERKIINN